MLLIEPLKKCSRCSEEKSLCEFYQHAKMLTADKRHTWCKKCFLEYRRWKWANDPALRAKQAIEIKRRNASSPRNRLAQARWVGLKRRPTDNPITINELIGLWEAQKGMCAVSGIKMTWGYGNQNKKKLPTSVSIDRIDNLRGYEFGNVRLICDAYNSFRGQMSDDEMFEMAEALCCFRRRSNLKAIA